MNRSSTYDNAIEVWKDTLAGMELLVNGSLQELRSVNVLLGLLVWHLYPVWTSSPSEAAHGPAGR
ncbi:hypothetical protein BDW71DRAFT_187054 [Aspergillus fruticulosus]